MLQCLGFAQECQGVCSVEKNSHRLVTVKARGEHGLTARLPAPPCVLESTLLCSDPAPASQLTSTPTLPQPTDIIMWLSSPSFTHRFASFSLQNWSSFPLIASLFQSMALPFSSHFSFKSCSLSFFSNTKRYENHSYLIYSPKLLWGGHHASSHLISSLFLLCAHFTSRLLWLLWSVSSIHPITTFSAAHC